MPEDEAVYTPSNGKYSDVRMHCHPYDISVIDRSFSADDNICGHPFNSDVARLSDGVWLDVGSHIGSFAIRMLMDYEAHVVCVEPFDANVCMIDRNLRLNDLSEYATIIKGAVVSGGKKTVSFWQHAKYSAAGTTTRKLRGSVEHVVDAYNIDNLIRRYEITCVKIDVEGGEYDIVMGMKDIGMLDVLMVEYHSHYNSDPTRFYEMMKKYHDNFDVVLSQQDVMNRVLIVHTTAYNMRARYER